MTTSTEPPRPGGSVAHGRLGGESVRRSGGEPVRRLRLDVAYDGSGFRGFAENAGVRTVAGELRRALETVLRRPVALTCAGRTDAGVHARGQVVTLDVEGAVDLRRLRDSLNSMIGPEIVVRAATMVGADLDARFSARWRRYRYHVLDAAVPDPFLATTSWWVQGPLDLPAMNSAAESLLGEHDFSSFCRRPKGESEVSLVRRVLAARWTSMPLEVGGADRDGADPGDADSVGADPPAALLCFEIAASAFCHQMVRSIVGALVRVGTGRLEPTAVAALLAARDRDGAPQLAPPQGLTLWQVGYDEWV
jgi:tRNA pseudouridine38-40 synthase